MKKKNLSLLMAVTMLASTMATVPASAASEADYYAYAPTANSYRSTGGEIALTWRNPVETPTKITLYEISADGTQTKVSDEFATTADTSVTTVQTGLATGKLYEYKVVFDFANHDSTSTVFSSTADTFTPGNEQVGNSSWTRSWKVQVAAENRASDLYIDPNVNNGGSYSLHASNNWPTEGAWKETGSALSFGPLVDDNKMTAGNEYRLKGDFKLNKYKPIWEFGKINTNTIATYLFDTTDTIDKDWESQDRQMTKTDAASSVTFYMTAFNCKDVWMDNLSFYEKSSNKNLLKLAADLGLFENTQAAIIPTATGVQSGKNVAVTFAARPDDTENSIASKKLYVYENIDGKDVTRAVLDPTDLSVNLDGVNGKLKVSNKNSRYVMSVKSDVTIEKAKEKIDYYVKAPTITPKMVTVEEATISTMQLSWRNPGIAPSKVSVYDITNPKKAVLIKNDFDTTAAAPISYSIDNLVEGKQYVYKIVCDFAGHDSTSVILARYAAEGADDVTKDYAISGESWCVRTSGPQNSSFINIDNTESHSGTSSLHISNSADGGVSCLRITDKNASQLKTGDVYTLSFWLKAENYTQTGALLGQTYQDGWFRYIKDAASPVVVPSIDWTEYKTEFTVKDNYNVWPYIIIKADNMKASDIWIDDITVRLKDSETDYVPKATFDNSVAAFNVTDEEVTGIGDQSASISYSIPSSTLGVYIYEKDSKTGDLILRANVSDLDTLTLDGLVNDTENDIIIKTLSTDYVLSSGVTLKATPKPDAYRTGDYKLYSGITEINAITTGDMTVKLDVSNIEMGNSFTPCYIVALYKQGEMVDCQVIEDVTIANGVSQTLSGTVTIPQDATLSQYSIKAFLWQDFEQMGILKTFGEF